MKIKQIKTIIDTGKYSQTPEYQQTELEIINAISSIVNPADSDIFTLCGIKKANGVVPIKTNFINTLDSYGWKNEYIADEIIKPYRIDSTKLLTKNTYFGVEWETGNISSSHRAINRLLLCMIKGILTCGILVLPSREMYNYLTDRVGNFTELEPYFDIWIKFSNFLPNHVLKIIEIEHDAISDTIPPIKKGTDGRALR